MGNVEVGDEVDCVEPADIFESGLRAVSKQTKGGPGDKTMMDALVPAVQAIRSAASCGGPIPGALYEAALAARAGANLPRHSLQNMGGRNFSARKPAAMRMPEHFQSHCSLRGSVRQ